MALVREKDGKRLHVKSTLMGESLVSKEFIEKLDIAQQEKLLSRRQVDENRLVSPSATVG